MRITVAVAVLTWSTLAAAAPDTLDEVTAKPHQKGKVKLTHTPGDGIVFHGEGKEKLKLRLIVQPMLRVGQASTAADLTTDLIIRRARVSLAAKLAHHLGMRFDLSVKNMHLEIHNMYGSWKPRKHLEVQFGFIKAPGGLERDTSSFDQPFIERSVVTFLNYDHEVGVKVSGDHDEHGWRWAGSVTRNPPPLPGGDPEDSPVIPTGVESEDISRAASKWNAAARIVAVPSDRFEASLRTGVRIRPDEADFGEIAVEPYDSTYLTNRPWHGLWTSVSADAAVVEPHWKAVVEGGFRRDGAQLEYPDGTAASEREVDGGHLYATNGYAVFGFTPHGRYGAAVDAAPLERGWEVVVRVNGSRIKPVDQGAATMGSVEVGWHWEATPQLRVQADLAVEKFGRNDRTLFDENRDATRIWAQVWATLRL